MSDLDLDEIRQAMEDEPYMGFTWACKWLLALADEVERLRAEHTHLHAQLRGCDTQYRWLCDEVQRLRAERDALRVDNDRLRRDVAMGVDDANRMPDTIEDLRNDLA